MTDAPLPKIHEKYGDFFIDQKNAQESIQKQKEKLVGLLTTIKNFPEDAQRNSYDTIMDHIEGLRGEVDTSLRALDDLVPKITEKARENMRDLRELTKIMKSFIKRLNRTKTSKLETLSRAAVNPEKLTTISRRVYENRYGGRGQKTRRLRRRAARPKN